jgi:DNA replication protein DnaC
MTAAAPAASPAPPQVLLAHHLRQLKLPTFLREYEKVAAEAAREGLDHVRFLLRLAELELIDRERRMVERRIRAAHFSAVKSFDTFDFTAIQSLNKPLTLELARCEYLIARDNVIALGNSGRGKTHVRLALGLAACQRGFPVCFFTAAGLVHQLMEARDERRLLKLQAQLAAVKLLIVDELGMCRSRRPARSFCLKYSASVTNVARPSSRRIFHSRNGPPSSVASVSLARFSIASRIMSIFWS